MNVLEFFKKRKIRAKKFWMVTVLTIIEIVFLLWYFNWTFNIALIIPAVQYIDIFEKKDIWDKLTEEEKKDLLISEDEMISFIKAVVKQCSEGKTAEEIIEDVETT